MDIERTLETQRFKLLRIIAGLAVVLEVLALAPVSRWFSEWTLGIVGSFLSRAEAAARCLLLTRVYLIARQNDLEIDREQIADALDAALIVDGPDISLAECRHRLKRLRAVLMDLPRHALRLLHRIAKRCRRNTRSDRTFSRPDLRPSTPLRAWRQAALRVERPPDKGRFTAPFFSPLPGCRAGGAGG